MRWRLTEKLGRAMDAMHIPAPPFKEIAKVVHDFMGDLEPAKPFWRTNWHLFNTMSGPWDLYTPPHIAPPDVKTTVGGAKVGQEVMFRTEFQTLRKLPKSGAILFGIRSYQRPLDWLRGPEQEDNARALLRAVQLMPPSMVEYTGADDWKEAVVHYLESILPLPGAKL
jgi:hypothetical protein